MRRVILFAISALVLSCAAAHPQSVFDANGNFGARGVIGGRPAGCPRLFCGCEASLYLFGKIRPELNLASNWIRKFPRTSPAPGMAAARSGHVMVLMSHVEGNNWLVHDGNSGGRKTRQHVRSIKGYVIVNPRGEYARNDFGDDSVRGRRLAGDGRNAHLAGAGLGIQSELVR